MSSVLWRAVGGPSIFKPSASRLFSFCRINHNSSKELEILSNTQQELDKNKEQKNKIRREKDKARRQQIHQDAEKYAKYRAKLNRYNNRYRTEPEFREKELARNSRRLREDAEYRERGLKRMRAHHHKSMAEIPWFHLRRSIRAWLTHPWVLDLPWKRIPEVHGTKVQHHCEGCGLSTRRPGARIWWRHRSDPELYDCHACFFKTWPSCMPKGYEDVSSFKELVARKEELDRLESKEATSIMDEKTRPDKPHDSKL